jgi:hypothetical protein
MLLQLNPTIPVITPKGRALAHLLMDYGEEHHLMWIVFQDDTGECWTWPNPDIRIQNNVTFNRNVDRHLTTPKLPHFTLERSKEESPANH